VAWGFLGSLELVVSGWLLAGVAPSLSRPATVALCVTFPLSLLANWMGQLSPLVLLLAVTSWRLIQAGYDRAAGAALAFVTFKPQLVIVIIPLLLLRSMRGGRWGVVVGFLATTAILCLASSAFLPEWPHELLWALRYLPVPTAARPEIGVAWWTVLQAAGLQGWPLVGAYAAVALPMATLVVRSAWRVERPAFDLLAWGTLAAFFVAPYAQFYDFPVLLPALLLVLRRSGPILAMTLVLGIIAGLYVHLFAVLGWGVSPCSMFWFPVFLAIALASPALSDATRLRTPPPRWPL
jgi:hypothetical protein